MSPEGLRILHVDDDPEDLLLAQEALVGAGPTVEVTPAQTIDEAKALLAGNDYDAVLVDYSLGADTGAELVATLRAKGVDVPLIALTGVDDPSLVADIMRAGADDYMSKNELDPGQLIKRIDALHTKRSASRREAGRHRRLLARGRMAEQILDGIPMGVVALDEEGAVVHVNDAAIDMVGSIEGLMDALPAWFTDSAQVGWVEGLRLGDAPGRFDAGVGGDRLRVITVREAPEQAADERVAHLHQLLGERRAAMAEVVACVAHDLRGHLRRMRAQGTWPSEQDGAFDQLDMIIGELVDYARLSLQEQRPEKVDLNEMLGSALGILASTIPDIRSRVDAGPLPAVLGDPLQMRQMLLNLVQNAHRHGGPSSKITIRREGKDIVIKDDGPGIPAEFRKSVFKPFRVVAEGRVLRSHGIGLAAARRIMQTNGGNIVLDDEGGFHLSFPQVMEVDEAWNPA